MDSEQKSRGRKHHTNKKKYNKSSHSTNTKKNMPPTQMKSATRLESNWDRYEQQEPEHSISSSTDFSILANVPVGRGSHFQFKSDRDVFEGETNKSKVADIFNLDLNLLSHSIACFPFYLRSDVDDKYFTNNQRIIMDRTALDNAEKYKQYLKATNRLTPKESVLEQVDNFEEETDDEGRDEVDTDDEILAASKSKSQTPEKSPEPVMMKHSEPDQDLEKWLDDVLDD